jgi:predicted ArsR family transcriptional regulator
MNIIVDPVGPLDAPDGARQYPIPAESVLAVLPATIAATAAQLGVTEGAAHHTLCALLRAGRVRIAERVVEMGRRVAVWRAA